MKCYTEADFTEQFDGALYVPREKGVYMMGVSKMFRYWDGEAWHFSGVSPNDAMRASKEWGRSPSQTHNFRGLKVNPLDPMKYVVAA